MSAGPESTVTVFPSKVTVQPICFSISIEINVSCISGQLCRMFCVPFKTIAAKIGNTAFLLPLTLSSPERRLPPKM